MQRTRVKKGNSGGCFSEESIMRSFLHMVKDRYTHSVQPRQLPELKMKASVEHKSINPTNKTGLRQGWGGLEKARRQHWRKEAKEGEWCSTVETKGLSQKHWETLEPWDFLKKMSPTKILAHTVQWFHMVGLEQDPDFKSKALIAFL